ncbi:hypothetical protein QYZ45_27510 [Vibrio parahaemolyticus]|nr:hypothetical protein [Vibrio parahaemolyticus]
MNECDIQTAVEAIMSLRPAKKSNEEESINRAKTKRRYDELVFQRELTEIETGERILQGLDFSHQQNLRQRKPHKSLHYKICDRYAIKRWAVMTTTRKTRQHKHVIGPFNVDKKCSWF